jgi:hypothetical protein
MSASESSAIATLPSTCVPILSPKGKETGTRYFMGTASASSLRATGKKLGLKGKALGLYVDDALRSEEANRAAMVAATVAALTSKGFISDTTEVYEKTATIKFKKPAPKVEPVPVTPAVDPRIAIAENLVRGGVFKTTEEALAAMG